MANRNYLAINLLRTSTQDYKSALDDLMQLRSVSQLPTSQEHLNKF